jgi:hypothetical protein
MLTTSRTGTRIIFVEEVNRHWSVSTHLVTDQKTRIIQLRRSRLSKRRILLRIDRSILLDKRIIQLNVLNDWTLFTLISDNSSRCLAICSSSENQLIVTIHKRRLNFFEANKFFIFHFFSHNQFLSQSNFLANLYQDVSRNINQLLSLWSRFIK